MEDRYPAPTWLTLAVIVMVICHGFFGSVSAQATGAFDNKLLCMADMVSNVEESCSKGAGQAYYTELEDLLKRYLGQCFNTNFTGRALHVMLPDISTQATSWLKVKADQFKAQSGIEVVTTFVPAKQINVEIEFELGNNLTYMHDGWILDPVVLADITALKGFLDLRPLVTNDQVASNLNWTDVLPFFDTKAGMYDRSLVVMPMDGHMELLYYRKDLFSQFKLKVPNTWEELLATALLYNQTLAAEFNNTRPLNSSVPFAFCMERRKACGVGSHQLLSIAAPYIQLTGVSHGLVFDPVLINGADITKAPLVNNPAMLRSLEIHRNLSAMSPPYAHDNACDPSTSMPVYFKSGMCLMTIGLGETFRATNGSGLTGNVGVAPLPGTAQVLSREQGALVPCTLANCPHATPLAHEDGSVTYVNRAPFAAGGGWVAAVNARSSPTYQNYAFLFFAFLNSPNISMESMVHPNVTDFSPYRRQHFKNLAAWTGAGFNLDDTSAYLAAGLNSLSHPNVALDLRVEPNSGNSRQPSGGKSFRDVYNNAIANLTMGLPPETVMQQMTESMNSILGNPQEVNPQALAQSYHLSIQYTVPRSPPSPGTNPGSSGSHLNWVPIAIVLPVVTALLLIAAGVVYEIRNTRKHKNLFGKVVPPGVGPDTSILITDIQDSTVLWEGLATETMDKAIKEHHECIRRLLSRHSGYESATEGDSFILAFHSPKDALLFAMDAQDALLHVEWPVELLEQPLCAPVYVQGIAKDTRPKHLQDILDVSEPPLSTTGSSKIKALSHGLSGGMGSLTLSLGLTQQLDEVSHPAIPALTNVPLAETYSFAVACQRAWKEAAREDPNKVLIFRGLRVRMGVHAGMHHEADVTYNRTDARTHYSGETLTLGRAVSEASHGGMVLISEETYKKLPLERLWDKYLVLHVGEHKLKETLPNLNLYHALNRSLEGRLAYLGPQRSLNQIDPGVLDAPIGCVTVAFMNVVGAQTLLSWNADMAQQALKVFHAVVGEELKRRRGYLVEAVDGLFLAAFQSPVEALLWALQCNEDMIRQAWSEELLGHELCEELLISAPNQDGDVVNTTVFRGLRLKTGVDTGQVLGEVHAMTGRMTYRGKVMNRAARIASTASTGQVLCSIDSWNLATTNDGPTMKANNVSGNSMGHFRLKGVSDRIEIYHCRKLTHNGLGHTGHHSANSAAKHWKWDHSAAQTIGPEDIVLGPATDLRRVTSVSARDNAALVSDNEDGGHGGSDGDGDVPVGAGAGRHNGGRPSGSSSQRGSGGGLRGVIGGSTHGGGGAGGRASAGPRASGGDGARPALDGGGGHSSDNRADGQ